MILYFSQFFMAFKQRKPDMLKDMELLQFPDERLRRVSQPVENFDEDLKLLSKEMLKVMYQSMGIGLAAPQVNKPIRR